MALVAGTWVYSQADGNEIRACVNKAGMPRIVDSNNECKSEEVLLAWNIQGLQGEKGDEGDPGEKGEKGDDGKDGMELHVFDANGQELGIYVGDHTANPSEQPITFNTDLGVFLKFAQSGAEQKKVTFEPRSAELLFEQKNCEGNAFASINASRPIQNVFSADGDGTIPRVYSLFLIGKEPAARTILSRSSGDEAIPCVNFTTPQIKETLTTSDIVLPFTEPLAWPLEVKPL